jgi:hypothetical protein
MSDTTMERHTWVAFGPAGAVGSIHSAEGGYSVRVLSDENWTAVFPTLDVAKSALHSRLEPGSEWPEFREH